jgi:hypothetical protein
MRLRFVDNIMGSSESVNLKSHATLRDWQGCCLHESNLKVGK